MLSHVEEETYTKKIAKLFLAGKTVLVPANPEEASLLLTPDNDKFWHFTNRGFWLVDFNGNASRLSQDKFNGKTYDELQDELRTKLGDSGALLWWVDNPVFSPDGSKIVYMTNRDCVDSDGSSLWLYDLATGEERPLVKNVNAEHYRAVAWLDDSHVLYAAYYTKEGDGYYISDVAGNRVRLNLVGRQPYVLGVYPGPQILYTPDFSASREICLVKVDLATNAVEEVYKNTLDGTLREPYSFSPGGSRLAFMYAPDSNNTVQYLVVVNLVSKQETVIKRAPLREGLRAVLDGFTWLDDSRLLIRVTKTVNGISQISSWIYSVR